MLDACLLPELSDLTAGLKSVFLETEFAGQGFNLEAEPNPYSSTFPSRIVTCRFDGGRELRLLCKFAAGRDEGDAGHRRGLRYEASVYRWVLQPLQATVPRFYGVHRADSENHMWI